MARRSQAATVAQLLKQMDRDKATAKKARIKLRRSKFRRAAGWTARTAVAAVWAGRRVLAVLYVTAGLEVGGVFIAGHAGSAGAVVVCWVAAGLVTVAVGRARGWHHFRVWYWLAVLTVGAGWLVTVACVGDGAPLPGVLGAAAVFGSVPWWTHLYRMPAPAEPVVEIDDRHERFAAAIPGNVLPEGTQLHSLETVSRDDDGDGEPDMLGWSGIVQLPRGSRETYEQIQGIAPNLAAAFSVPAASVVIELAADQVPDKARIMILNRSNPTHAPNYYDRTWIRLEDGCYPAGVFPDGTRSWLRMYEPGSGPVHSLYSGDSGAGKSRGMSLDIIQSTMTGLCVPFVADPQGGQSMSAWAGAKGKAAWIATDPEEIWLQTNAILRFMQSRSARLMARDWLDEDGVTRTGLDFFDPAFTPELPILDWTLDEAHNMLSDPGYADLVEPVVKMARKTGTRCRFGTQHPSISDLGNRMGIRNQLAAGNLVCYRISTRSVNGMLLPSWAPSPFDIPAVTPEGRNTKGMNFTYAPASGGSRPTFQRSAWAKNEHKWADTAAELIPAFTREDEEAMGDDWFKRDERREARLHGPVVVDLAARRDTTPKADPVSARAADRILAYLADPEANGRTGVIADRLDMPKPTVSTTCKRLAEAGQIRAVRTGIWALPEGATA